MVEASSVEDCDMGVRMIEELMMEELECLLVVKDGCCPPT